MHTIHLGGSACPMNNFCTVTRGEIAPDCGVVSGHMSPLTLAEHGCLRALSGAQRTLASAHEALSVAGPRTIIEAAWSEHDIAMAAKTPEEAAMHFAESTKLAQGLTGRTDIQLPHLISASLLIAHQPAFQTRRAGQEVTIDQAADIKLILSGACAALEAAPVHSGLGREHYEEPDHIPCLFDEGVRTGLAAKLLLPLIAQRQGIILWPASPREQMPRYPFGAPEIEFTSRHDVYQVIGPQARDKLPIQIKTLRKKQKPYGPRGGAVLHIYYQTLLTQTAVGLERYNDPAVRSDFAQLVQDSGGRSSVISSAARWIVAEAQGQPLASEQTLFLDALTSNLIAKMRQHKHRILDRR